MNELIGKKFGRLTILSICREFTGQAKVTVALCQCDCGSQSKPQLSKVKSGLTKSCGCISREFRAGYFSSTHDMSKSRTYKAWQQLNQRCRNKNHAQYKNYGGRGIKVCDRWLKFENFYEDMRDPPKDTSIDRIDNNKGYSKKNCRWAFKVTQQRNTRISKYWFINGVRYDSSVQAAEKFGVHSSMICCWCDGSSYLKDGIQYYRQPKPGCYSELKYKEAV